MAPKGNTSSEHSSPGRAIGRGEVLDITSGTVRVRGHLELQRKGHSVRPVRIPRRSWDRFPPAAAAFRAQTIRPSGVRLSFRTDATRLVLRVTCTRLRLPQVDAEQNGFALHLDDEPTTFVASPVDAYELLAQDGATSTIEQVRPGSSVVFEGLPPRDKLVDIWFPQMMIVDFADLEADAPVRASESSDAPVWVHYGSSISHGGNSESPSSTWPVVATRIAGLQLINLGFAAQCHLDQFVATAIADIDADIISLELGVNIVGSRSMDQRTFVPAVHGFLDRLRLSHPQTPVIVISALLWRDNETKAGPTTMEFTEGQVSFGLAGGAAEIEAGALSLEMSRDQLAQVVTQRRSTGEPISYLDGRTLYGEADVDRWPMADNLHPDAGLATQIGQRFVRLASIGQVGSEGRPGTTSAWGR